jgi:hypothetical protein
MTVRRLRHEFVECVPEDLEDAVIYISLPYSTAVHKCCCGCGEEVVTPFSPRDWSLTYDGVSVSLHPSIGNWNFACESHYWIVRDNVMWEPAPLGAREVPVQRGVSTGARHRIRRILDKARSWLFD